MSRVLVTELALWRGLEAPVPATYEWEVQQNVIDAVEAQLSHTYVIPTPLPEDARQGILLAAARLLKRKDSPNGVEDLNDFGPIRVSRWDPDVEALLSPYKTWVLA